MLLKDGSLKILDFGLSCIEPECDNSYAGHHEVPPSIEEFIYLTGGNRLPLSMHKKHEIYIMGYNLLLLLIVMSNEKLNMVLNKDNSYKGINNRLSKFVPKEQQKLVSIVAKILSEKITTIPQIKKELNL